MKKSQNHHKKFLTIIVISILIIGGSILFLKQKKAKQQTRRAANSADQNQANQTQDSNDAAGSSADDNDNQANNNSPESNNSDRPELGIGDSGKYVIELHQKLNAVDLFQKDLIDVDQFGEKTQYSVMLFQLSQNMEPNGVVDEKTWEALDNPQSFDKTALDASKIPIDPGHISEDTAQDKMIKSDEKIEVTDDTKTSKTKPDSKKTHEGKKIAYFTFDDGPHPTWTPKVKALLEKYDAKATFFVIGEQVPDHTDLVKQNFKYGCVIGNHTYTHINLSTASKKTLEEELTKTNDVIKKITG